MVTTLRLPAKAPKDVLLVYKYTSGEAIAPIETAQNLSLIWNETEIEGTQTISKFFAAERAPELLGKDATEQAVVDDWLAYASVLRTKAKKDVIADFQKKLEAHLASNTFFVGNQLTLVDLVIFGILHAYTKNMMVDKSPNVLRWFDLVQHVAVKEKKLEADFPLFEIDLENVPEPSLVTPAAKAEESRSKEEKSDTKKVGVQPDVKKDDVQQVGATDKKAKKEKKEKKEKVAAPAPEPDQPVVSRLDIRVGIIRSCEKHADADSLYVEQIDLGEGRNRTIVSGLVKHYSLEEMQGRHVLCLANLKPANMRGVKSEGMVLCASKEDKVELLSPVDTSKVNPGDRVFFEELEGQPEAILPPKKKYWEAVQPDFNTKDDKLAYYQEKPFLIKTSTGETVKCQVNTVQGGNIK